MSARISRRDAVRLMAGTGVGFAGLGQAEFATANAQLLIRDGNPEWYLSPDIWVVPGADPDGPPGSPVAGQPAFLWAHVSNNGNREAKGVQIDFYWANPALQVLRSNAHLVGSAFVDLRPEQSQEVLCLVPWHPVIVNHGHECLVAVAKHFDDPLPSPVPDAFDPPVYRQVAQKNLTVLVAGVKALVRAITLWGGRRADKKVTVAVEIGRPLDKTTLERLGIQDLQPADGRVVDVGLDRRGECPEHDQPLGDERLDLSVPRGTSAAVYVHIRATNLAVGQYQVVQVTERSEGRLLGGLAFVVVREMEEPQ